MHVRGGWPPLPYRLDALTPEWITRALQIRYPYVQVVAADISRFVKGATSKAFVSLKYAAGSDGGLPSKICVKGNLEGATSPFAASHITEARFFRDIAPRLDTPLPRAYYADDDGERGLVILEDLVAQGSSFPLANAPWAPEEVAKLLELMGRLHGTSWGWRAGDPDWLQIGSSSLRLGKQVMFTSEAWREGIRRHHLKELLPRSISEVSGIIEANNALQNLDDAEPCHSLCHGDPHPGQVYVSHNGMPALLDWQTVALAPWAKDVSYFVGGALAVADRRLHEKDLLQHYLEAFKRSGGPAIPFESAWTVYRRQSLQGLVWVVVTPAMQEPSMVNVMVERYATAVADLVPLDVIH